MAEQFTRSEFLRGLLNQNKAIENNGSPLVNPSVPNGDDVETLYNANVSNSTVSAGSTAIQNETSESEQYKEERNGWQRFWDTVGNFVHNINEGVQKYILDPIGDAGIYLYGLISGDEEGAQNAINYDWGAHYLNVVDQLDFGSHIMSGDFFGFDGGNYWENWGDTGSIEASRQNFANMKASSLMSDASPEVQQGFETGEQIFGALLPSIILAVATGGASAEAQAGVFAGEVGVAGLTGFGRGVDEALAEGGDYGKAGLYGLERGAQSAALTYVGGKIGGQLLGGGAGSKVGNEVFSKTGNVLISTATKIATNAGIAGVTAAVDEALIKPLEKLTYDEQAWAKAYGDKSATYNTLKRAGQAGLTATAMSVLSQSISEGAKVAVQGKDKYVENFLNQYSQSTGNVKKINANVEKMNKLSEQMSNAYSKLESGVWTEEQYNAYVSTRLNKFESISAETSKLFDSYTAQGYGEKLNANYGEQLNTIKSNNAGAITSKLVSTNAMPRAKATAFIKMAMDNGYSYADIKGATQQFTSANGNSVISIGQGEKASLTYISPKTDKKVTIPLQIGFKGEMKMIPTTEKQITNALMLVGKSSEFKNDIILKPNQFIKDDVTLPNKTNELTITPEVAKEITKGNPAEQLKEFFEVVAKNKGKQVIKDGDRYLIINTYKDKNGVAQTAITTTDSKFATIKSMNIQPTGKIVPTKISGNSVIAEKIGEVVASEEVFNNENKFVKAYGELNHETILSLTKSQEIVEVIKRQVMRSFAKKEGNEYNLRMPKGELSKDIFTAINTLSNKTDEYGVQLKSDLDDAIEEIAEKMANSEIITTTPSGVKITSLVGRKEDLVKAINGLVKAKSELSKIAKLEKRYDLAIEKKNAQIQAIRERANAHLEKANEFFTAIRNDLKKQIKDLKETKDLSVQITRQRDKIKDLVTGDYNYNEIEERDLHTVNMLAKPLANLTRNKGRYSVTPENLESWIDAGKHYVIDNYELTGSVEFDEDVKLALDNAIACLKQDVNKPEISVESYRAVKDYQDKLMKYERKLSDIENHERKPSAYTASVELDSYDMNIAQKITDVITKNFGGKAGEIFKQFGFGEITKKCVIALDQASGEKINFIAEMTEKLAECMPKGFHHKETAGEINGVKVTKGELVMAYITTNLAPVNQENADIGGIGFRGKKNIEWAYSGEGHLAEMQEAINKIITPEEKDIANKLFKFINGDLQDKYVQWRKEVKHDIDVPIVKDYLPMYKETSYLTSIDKMVRGEPAFRYAEKRTNDKRGLVIPDIVDMLTNYIDGLGIQMYMTPRVHEAYALLNSKDQKGVIIHDKIKAKYGDASEKYLTDLIDAWIKKSNSQTQNIVTKTINWLTSGYTVAKLADFVRPVKNFFSYITASGDMGKQTKAYFSRVSKEVRDDVEWYIENHIYNLKYREYDNALLKGNAPTTYQGFKGKVDKVLMTPVTKVDKAAMVMGLTSIINDLKSHGADMRDPAIVQYVKDAYSIFNLCNVNGDPNHQNLLNEHTLTKYVFNILAGAKRAQVASCAIQASLWQQNHKITKEVKAEMDKALIQAQKDKKVASENVVKADELYQKGIEKLNELRVARDNLSDNKKEQQLGIVNKYNPMEDSYHVGIRKVEDIKTWEEVLTLNDEKEGQFAWGDFSREDAQKALESGKITVYSSKEIEQGTFVSTSKLQAEEYAGGQGSKIYSKEIELNKVAWINGDEGQFADASVEEDINGLIAEARQSVKDQVSVNKSLREAYEEAREQEARAFGRERTEQNKQDSYKHYEYAGGRKIPLEILAKTLLAGILTTGVSMITNWLYGKKDFDEYEAQDIIYSMATNSFLNWIPVVDTVSGMVLNGYEIDPPAISTLNNFINIFSEVYDSFKNGDISRGLITSMLTALEGITGLPLDTLRKYIYGITKMFDPEAALRFNSVFYATTPTYASRMYNEYVANGNEKMAKAYLAYMSSEFKGNTSDDFINSELYYLSSQGYNAIPKAVPTSYNDENGVPVKLTSAQITQFTQLYGESLSSVRSLIKSAEYKMATSEEKAKLVKQAYDYYFSYAKAKTLGTAGDSRMSKLLVLTNGNVDMAKYLVYLQKVGGITENKQKTRKELVIDYINRIRDLNKGEKLLLMYLAGYNVTGDSSNTLVRYLGQNGISQKEAKDFLGVNDEK